MTTDMRIADRVPDDTPTTEQPMDAPTTRLPVDAPAEPPTAVGPPDDVPPEQPPGGGEPPGGPPSGPPGGPPPGGQPPAGGPPPSGPDGALPIRRLRRSRNTRVVAGVAGGLSEYSGVDPVVFRVLFAVLSLFGGAGLLLYVVGWLFLPDAGEDTSAAENLIGRGRSGSSPIEGVLLAVAAAVLAIVVVHGDDGEGVLLLALVVIGAVLVSRHLDRRNRAPRSQPPPPPPVTSWAAAERPAGATTITAPAPVTGPWGPPPVKKRRERSALGWYGLLTAMIATGVLGMLDAADSFDPGFRPYVGLPLGILGVTMLIGAWLGRARWLALLGVPMVAALVVAGGVEGEYPGGWGDRQYHPRAVADVRPAYNLTVGNLEVDLSDVDFAGRDLTTRVRAGVGNLVVTVPPNVDVTVDASTNAGEVRAFGEIRDGAEPEYEGTDLGADGSGGGHLDLTIELGLGSLEVRREAA